MKAMVVDEVEAVMEWWILVVERQVQTGAF
jgi:hypothetical protein